MVKYCFRTNPKRRCQHVTGSYSRRTEWGVAEKRSFEAKGGRAEKAAPSNKGTERAPLFNLLTAQGKRMKAYRKNGWCYDGISANNLR
jgi:hypothetical protein